MSDQPMPPGWTEAEIRAVANHYNNQTEEEQFAEIEAALEAENITWVAVPTDRVPEVQALLARDISV